jgi:hypothetical protein
MGPFLPEELAREHIADLHAAGEAAQLARRMRRKPGPAGLSVSGR